MINIAPLAAALTHIADTTSDLRMANGARHHERLLRSIQASELERSVKSIRVELDWYKSDYRDSFDQSEVTQAAIQSAYEVAKRTINAITIARQMSIGAAAPMLAAASSPSSTIGRDRP